MASKESLLAKGGGALVAEKDTSADRAVHQRAVFLLTGILLASLAACAGVVLCGASHPVVLSHGLLSLLLGLRHAVDCDHLAAIDNVTRQLVLLGQRPVSVGFWFALGHSTIVVLLTVALASGYSAVWHGGGTVALVRKGLTLAAAVLSVVLLGGIGLLNARVALGLFSDWTSLRKHSAYLQDKALESTADSSLRTALTAVPFLKRLFSHVDRPVKMYMVGVLFGLSFDTASQVGLIALAAMSSTAGQVPPVMVLLFPLCFSCGMCLVDTGNGLLMLLAYNWATVRPMQKLVYNLLVTTMSAGVALAIGSLEVLQILGQEAGLTGGLWSWVQDVDMGSLGCAVVASFLTVFGLAVCCAHLHCGACKDETWDGPPAPQPP